ncbi:MAG: response regulator transcription factor [Deltaproteobacteria bacterium]|nr:response regulator transcription factor [Deltaproteobacteria bacterium]MBI3387858.1 response regulator transcription factor [Deltaproteobacteria bacterium]
MTDEPKVFVVDDDAAMRESLQWLIQSVGVAVETFATAEEFLDAYDPGRPGCLVLDVRMPGMGGLNLQQELNRREIGLPIRIVTGYAEVPMAVRALKAGAFDFIEKPFSDQLLLERVRQAITIDRETRHARAVRAEAALRVARLTPREREVMELVIVGYPNKIIADRLGLSPKTVEVHRSQVMRRLEVDSLAELVRLVILAQGSPAAV